MSINTKVKLSTICEFLNGGTPSRKIERYFHGEIPWITSADISEAQDEVSEARFYITQEAIDSSSTKIVPKGNILLVSRTGVGKVAITGVDICISQDFTGIIPDKNKVNLRYLFRFLQSRKPYFVYHQRGATIKGITRRVVEELEIPLPPLEEQRRIAAILDKADALRQKRRAALAKLDTLLQATFLDMFGDPVTNPMGWEKRPFDEIVAIDAPMVDPTLDEYRSLLHIGGDRIEKGTGQLLEAKTAEEDRLISSKFLFDNRYVLYSKIRPYLQKVALPNFKGLCSADVYPVRPKNNHLHRILLYLILLSDSFTKFTEQHSGRANIPKINRKQFLSFECYLPPKHLQQEFLEIYTLLSKQKKKYKHAEINLDNLFHALQQRAFSGQL